MALVGGRGRKTNSTR